MSKKDWSKDPRSKQDRIIEARTHVQTKSQRRAKAEKMMTINSERSLQEKIDRLNTRLGLNVGAKKERKRLFILLEKQNEKN